MSTNKKSKENKELEATRVAYEGEEPIYDILTGDEVNPDELPLVEVQTDKVKLDKAPKSTKKLKKPELSNEYLTDLTARVNEFQQNVIEPEKEAERKEAERDYDEVIESTDAFLELFNEDRFITSVGMRTPDNRVVLMKFRILPIGEQSGRLLNTLGVDKDLYADLSREEITAMKRSNEGKPLTAKQKKLLAKITKNATKKASDEGNDLTDMLKLATDLISTHMIPVSCETLEEFENELAVKGVTLEKFWMRIDVPVRLYLSQLVMSKFGVSGQDNLHLFQPS